MLRLAKIRNSKQKASEEGFMAFLDIYEPSIKETIKVTREVDFLYINNETQSDEVNCINCEELAP